MKPFNLREAWPALPIAPLTLSHPIPTGLFCLPTLYHSLFLGISRDSR